MQVGIIDTEIWDPGVLDRDNPRSLVNICPVQMQKFIEAIPPKVFTFTETELLRMAKPDFTSKCLRIQFWQEYVRAQDKNEDMVLSNVIKGITHKDYILHLSKERIYELAWICVPPRSYDVMQKQILEASLEKMREALTLGFIDTTVKEVVKPDGTVTKTTTNKINTSAIAEVRKTAEVLQNRVLGSMTQTIKHSHSLDEPKSKPPGLISVNALQEIDDSLDVLEAELDTDE